MSGLFSSPRKLSPVGRQVNQISMLEVSEAMTGMDSMCRTAEVRSRQHISLHWIPASTRSLYQSVTCSLCADFVLTRVIFQAQGSPLLKSCQHANHCAQPPFHLHDPPHRERQVLMAQRGEAMESMFFRLPKTIPPSILKTAKTPLYSAQVVRRKATCGGSVQAQRNRLYEKL